MALASPMRTEITLPSFRALLHPTPPEDDMSDKRIQRIAYDLRANATLHKGCTAWHCSIPADEILELLGAISTPRVENVPTL